LGNPKLRNSLLAIDNVFTDKIIKRIPKPEDFVADEPGSRSRNPYLRNPITRGDRKYDVHDMIFNLPRRLGVVEAQTVEKPKGLWVGTNDTNSCLIVNSESNGEPMPASNGNCQTLDYASAIPKSRYTHKQTSQREGQGLDKRLPEMGAWHVCVKPGQVQAGQKEVIAGL
jgi:hypothetical protein